MIFYIIDLIAAWLPIFSNFLVFVFAFVILISIIKLVRYFIYV